MFFDPLNNRVIDYVNGRDDLSRELIRAIGEASERFAEDRLRILRALRFATTLMFEIEPGPWAAVKADAEAIAVVSPERIRDELLKILVSPHRLRGFDLLDKSGL